MNNNNKLNDILKFLNYMDGSRNWFIEGTFIGRKIYMKNVGIEFRTTNPEGLSKSLAEEIIRRCNNYTEMKNAERKQKQANKKAASSDTFIPVVPEKRKKFEAVLELNTHAELVAKAMALGIPSEELAGQAIKFALERMVINE